MKVAIICQSQFGYHIDTYYYVKELSKHDDVSYLCWDYGKSKYADVGDISYIKRDKNIVIRNLRFIISAIFYIYKSKSDVFFIKYFKGAFLLKAFAPWKRFVLDIRTVSINRSPQVRFFEDCLLRFESLFFRNVTVISTAVAQKLRINRFKTIPLGAEVICNKNTFRQVKDEVNLLYVGTLNGRNIDVTVDALDIVVRRCPNLKFRYYIVGDGVERDTQKVKKTIEANALNDIVIMTGYLKHDELVELFSKTHVGIAYVPITDYYNVQPSTKIYEYIRSKIPVVATKTKANVASVESKFGVLAGQSAAEFSEGIMMLINNLSHGDISFEPSDAKTFSWESVVNDLKLYLDSLI